MSLIISREMDEFYNSLRYDHGEKARYGKEEEFKKAILHKRVVEWDEDKLVLDDGTIIEIKMSESDCCAYAGGKFEDVELDAMITDVNITERSTEEMYGTITNRVVVNVFHNRNSIAKARVQADDGNGGFYYSVGSLVIGDIHFPVVEA